jgi:hypothetical protein
MCLRPVRIVLVVVVVLPSAVSLGWPARTPPNQKTAEDDDNDEGRGRLGEGNNQPSPTVSSVRCSLSGPGSDGASPYY